MLKLELKDQNQHTERLSMGMNFATSEAKEREKVLNQTKIEKEMLEEQLSNLLPLTTRDESQSQSINDENCLTFKS